MARTTAPGVSVRLKISVAGDADRAAQHHGKNLGQYVEEAILEKLERDRQAFKVKRFETAHLDAAAKLIASPLPEDYGLPSGYALSPTFRLR